MSGDGPGHQGDEAVEAGVGRGRHLYSTVQYSTAQYSTVGGGPHHVQEAASTHRDLGRARAVAAWGLELQTEVREDYARISNSLMWTLVSSSTCIVTTYRAQLL